MALILDAGAKKDLKQAKAFYESQKKGLGFEFLDAVEIAMESLKKFPARTAAVYGPFHQLLMSRFPFAIIYAIEENDLYIVAIAHQHRAPDFWHDRIE